MDAVLKKQHGVHYTPPRLAAFLARQTVDCLADSNGWRPKQNQRLTVLDPACGDGELLASLIDQIRLVDECIEVHAFGFDTDPNAVKQTKKRLSRFGLSNVSIKQADFLAEFEPAPAFDIVIANPPYVRTQVLGGAESQRLADKFELTGRVDLYHAFAVAISQVLRPGGTMGLLTSNRFLSVKSGAVMRRLLSEEFNLCQLFDLGDTRLFEAAVLPAIVTGTRRNQQGDDLPDEPAGFHRIYQREPSGAPTSSESSFETLFENIADFQTTGEVETNDATYLIERGELVFQSDSVWTLVNSQTRTWFGKLRANQTTTFDELAEIKVGIKTTADAVFICEDWQTLGESKPESKLLLPLITHHDADRWSIAKPKKKVLYPYDLKKQKRSVIGLEKFPKTMAYLESHRERLEGRKYVADSGREWFEIWVPHQPADWTNPKIVWPDISEQPKFFLDSSGSIVNGDCYWIKLRPDVDENWLYLMLAVANSEIATRFYDTVFHNKLYAGRRRFMTQYVKDFPLPDLNSKLGKKIVTAVKRLVGRPDPKLEVKVESMVQEAFGF